jgi:hypothetical protein
LEDEDEKKVNYLEASTEYLEVLIYLNRTLILESLEEFDKQYMSYPHDYIPSYAFKKKDDYVDIGKQFGNYRENLEIKVDEYFPETFWGNVARFFNGEGFKVFFESFNYVEKFPQIKQLLETQLSKACYPPFS